MPTLRSTLVCLVVASSLTQAASAAEPPALTLEQALALAKRNNPSLQVARERLYQAELYIDKAWVMMKPQVNATGTYTHYNQEIAFLLPNIIFGFDQATCGGLWNPELGYCIIQGDPPVKQQIFQRQDSFGLYSTITQPIFLARAFSSIANAYHAYDLAGLNTENLEEFLLHTVEVAYYGTLATRKFLDIARHAVKIRKEHLKVARAKFEVGETAKITVLRAEIDVNRAEQDVKRAEHSLALAKEGLHLLIGLDQDFSLVPPEPPKRPAETAEAFTQRAMAQRRDLEAAKLNLAIAEELKDDAWYRFLPSLLFTGMLRVSDVKGFSDSYLSWNVGVALSVPIYDGGLRYAYLKEAKSKIREATIQIEDKKRAIASEIREHWLKMEMAEANLVKSRRSAELAREQVELAKASFDAGAATSLEVLDANSILFVSEINQAQEELNLHLAILKLQKAVRMFNPTTALGTTGDMEASPGGAALGGTSPELGSSAAEAAGVPVPSSPSVGF